MAEKIIATAYKEKWLNYNKKDGWTLNFGTKEFILVLVGLYANNLLEIAHFFLILFQAGG